MFDRFLAFSI